MIRTYASNVIEFVDTTQALQQPQIENAITRGRKCTVFLKVVSLSQVINATSKALKLEETEGFLFSIGCLIIQTQPSPCRWRGTASSCT